MSAEDNKRVKLRKKSEREDRLKIAAVGSDDERFKQVIRQNLKREETEAEDRESPDFRSQTRAPTVKCPQPIN